MVESKRRSSVLGALALLGGVAAAVLIKFNPTGTSVVPIGPMTLSLATTVGAASLLLALIAFLASAVSPRTGTGLPLLAILVCAAASFVAYKPDVLSHFVKPAAPSPQPAPAVVQTPAVSTPQTANDAPADRPKTIFDSDYPSSTPDAQPKKDPAPAQVNVPDIHVPTTPPHFDNSAAIADARNRFEAARIAIKTSLESTPDYQSAKADADADDTQLKQARTKYEVGSVELIAASQAAMDAHTKLRKIIADAMAKDPAASQAIRDLQAAQSTTH